MPGVRSLLLALAGVSLAPAVLAADASTDSSDVHALKTDTFKDFIKEHDLVLAEFYAPWCGHCKALAPEYEKAATELKGKNIQLAKVDCTEEADLCQEYGVEGYPTLKVFRGLDSHKPYNGARKSPAITSYMVKQSLPSVSVVTAENFEEVKSLDKVVVVAFIGEDDKETNKTYTALADSMRDDVLFAGTSSAELAKKEGVSLPAVVLYKEFDDRKDVYDGKFEAAALKAFIKSSSIPLVGEVGPETYSGYMSAGIPLAYIFADTAEEREQYASDFKDLAKKLKGKINFATIDSKAFGAHAANLNLIPEKFPAFAIQDTVSNKKYPFDQEKKLTKQDITKFVEGVIAGDIAPSVKSEAVPETNDGPVTVIVAHTYEEIVMNKDKDVLVEFYAPWCGHCKALAPKYDQLGSLYKDNKDFASKVTIAKVDATANDIPDEIQGFPTIKLFPAGSKDKPVEYTGSRTIEDLANFVRDNGKHKVDAYDEKKVEKDGSDVTGKPKDAEAPPKPSDAPESEEKADKEHEEL